MDQNAKQSCHLFFQKAIQQIKDGDLEAAMESNIQACACLEGRTGDRENARLLCDISLSLSDLGTNVRKRINEVLGVLHQALDLAQLLGDERNWALLNLHLGRAYNLGNRPYESVKHFEKGLKAVEELGDDDIKLQSAEFTGLFHFLHGMHQRALDYLEQVMSPTDTYRDGRLFNRMIPTIVGSCAAFTGHFNRAIGVMDASWRRVALKADYLSEPFYRAQLGNVLLMAGKRQEAFNHLEQARQGALRHKNVFALVWSQRALAYYLFLEDQPHESYVLLKSCLSEASRLGLQKPFYAFPWILELLYEYHRMGCQPIPSYDFQKEMDEALRGINIHLRGTALRIQAKQVMSSGVWEDGRVEELLMKSDYDLRKAQVPLDLAKTQVELALLRLGQDRRDQAAEFTMRAWEGLSFYGVKSLPPELRPFIHGRDITIRAQEKEGVLLRRYMDMFNNLLPSADLNEMLSRLVTLTCKFFKAERGAIFLASGNGPKSYPVLETTYNLNSYEVNGEAFRDSMLYVLRAYKNNQPIVVKKSVPSLEIPGHPPKAIVCLPFKLQGAIRGVLYHDATYSEAAFDFSSGTLGQIGRSLGTYINRMQLYCQRMEEKTVSALRESTSSDLSDNRDIITHSRAMHELLIHSDKAAKSDAPVLILGETGVGKELLARRLHHMGERQMGPFVAVNLSSIPEMLVESELFGHEKGSFTGAVNQKPGRMELANKGTLFIDEIGEISLALQVKLLRALEEKAFFRVGGVKSINSNFRLLAATNRNLVKEVNEGNLREDLFYRLNVVPLVVPPLRKRGQDIILLANYFLNKYSRKYQKPVRELSPENQAVLMAYHWPGNVRELQNVIERSVVLSDDLDLELMLSQGPGNAHREPQASSGILVDSPTLEELERRYIAQVIQKTGGRMSGKGSAAEILGMKRTTLYSRMKKLGIATPTGGAMGGPTTM